MQRRALAQPKQTVVNWDYYNVHERIQGLPSVSRRRGTNMEQFPSGNDVIKFPANLQNQTKISFIFGVVSI